MKQYGLAESEICIGNQMAYTSTVVDDLPMVVEMLHKEVIEPSDSPWSSPIVLVKKQDVTTRFCIDYRKLNDVTRKDSYPLPKIDDTMDALASAEWFSTLDLAAGYWQVELTPGA